jgi:hypothetical protein
MVSIPYFVNAQSVAGFSSVEMGMSIEEFVFAYNNSSEITNSDNIANNIRVFSLKTSNIFEANLYFYENKLFDVFIFNRESYCPIRLFLIYLIRNHGDNYVMQEKEQESFIWGVTSTERIIYEWNDHQDIIIQLNLTYMDGLLSQYYSCVYYIPSIREKIKSQ